MPKVRINTSFIHNDFRRQPGETLEVTEQELSRFENLGIRYERLDSFGERAQEHDARHKAKPPVVEK